MQNLTENGRARHGGEYDNSSINAHSVRMYSDGHGRSYMLSRSLDEEDRPYRAYGPIRSNVDGLLPLFMIAGAADFGASRSWSSAEKFLDEAVGTYNASIENTDPIVVFDDGDEGSTQRVIADGLSGTRVEMWFVSQDVIDRGTWGDEFRSPGWCWQRMDSQNIHGTFPAFEDAVADYKAVRADAIDAQSPRP